MIYKRGPFLGVACSLLLIFGRLFTLESLGYALDITIIPLKSIGRVTVLLREKSINDFIEQECNAYEYTQTNNWPIKRPITYFWKPCELFSHNITPLKDLGDLTGEQE
jgi:hypothetical protein